MNRREFLVLGGGTLAFLGCGGADGGFSPSGVTFPTVRHTLRTTDAAAAGILARLATAKNLDDHAAQAGASHPAGSALIEGRVETSAGALIAGATVAAFTDSGASTGTLWMNPNGEFRIFGVAPGRVFVRTTSGANGGLYLPAVADEVAILELTSAPGAILLVSHSGTTLDGTGAAEPSVTIQALGMGAPFPVASDGAGSFSLLPVPSSAELYYRLTKAGFVDTYTRIVTGTVSFSEDLQIFTAAERDAAAFKPPAIVVDPAKAVIHGVVRDAGGTALAGAVVSCGSGTVVYSDAAGSADAGLASSSSSGEFTIFNVDPGTPLVTALAAGLAVGLPLEAIAGAITIIPDLRLAAAASSTVVLSGTTVDLDGAVLGDVAVFSTVSDSSGAWSQSGLPANSRLSMRAHR